MKQTVSMWGCEGVGECVGVGGGKVCVSECVGVGGGKVCVSECVGVGVGGCV